MPLNIESPSSGETTLVLPPLIFLLAENSRKSNNLGPILRCACAFGIHTIVVVGYAKCAVEGSHGAAKHVNLIAFPTSLQAADYIRNTLECRFIVGLLGGVPNGYDPRGYTITVKSTSNSKVAGVFSTQRHCHLLGHGATASSTLLSDANNAVNHLKARSLPVSTIHSGQIFNETGNMCLAISVKDTEGLALNLAKHCDTFVHVPHVQVVAPKSDVQDAAEVRSVSLLDAPSCLSITLHHLTRCAGYEEHAFHGHKFEVQQPPNELSRNHVQQQRVEAKCLRERHLEDVVSESSLFSLFDCPGEE